MSIVLGRLYQLPPPPVNLDILTVHVMYWLYTDVAAAVVAALLVILRAVGVDETRFNTEGLGQHVNVRALAASLARYRLEKHAAVLTAG